MVHALDLGLQVVGILRRHLGGQRHAGADRHPMLLQALDFERIVGQQTDGRDGQVFENLRRHGVITLVGLVTEEEVGVNRIIALVLEIIRPQLVGQADSPSLLTQIDNDAGPLLGDPLHGAVQLGAAVAAQGAQYVAGEALGVNPDQHVGTLRHLPQHQRQVLLVGLPVFIHAQLKLPVGSRDTGTRYRLNACFTHGRPSFDFTRASPTHEHARFPAKCNNIPIQQPPADRSPPASHGQN